MGAVYMQDHTAHKFQNDLDTSSRHGEKTGVVAKCPQESAIYEMDMSGVDLCLTRACHRLEYQIGV